MAFSGAFGTHILCEYTLDTRNAPKMYFKGIVAHAFALPRPG
jgi:hypothetical protein